MKYPNLMSKYNDEEQAIDEVNRLNRHYKIYNRCFVADYYKNEKLGCYYVIVDVKPKTK